MGFWNKIFGRGRKYEFTDEDRRRAQAVLAKRAEVRMLEYEAEAEELRQEIAELKEGSKPPKGPMEEIGAFMQAITQIQGGITPQEPDSFNAPSQLPPPAPTPQGGDSDFLAQAEAKLPAKLKMAIKSGIVSEEQYSAFAKALYSRVRNK